MDDIFNQFGSKVQELQSESDATRIVSASSIDTAEAKLTTLMKHCGMLRNTYNSMPSAQDVSHQELSSQYLSICSSTIHRLEYLMEFKSLDDELNLLRKSKPTAPEWDELYSRLTEELLPTLDVLERKTDLVIKDDLGDSVNQTDVFNEICRTKFDIANVREPKNKDNMVAVPQTQVAHLDDQLGTKLSEIIHSTTGPPGRKFSQDLLVTRKVQLEQLQQSLVSSYSNSGSHHYRHMDAARIIKEEHTKVVTYFKKFQSHTEVLQRSQPVLQRGLSVLEESNDVNVIETTLNDLREKLYILQDAAAGHTDQSNDFMTEELAEVQSKINDLLSRWQHVISVLEDKKENVNVSLNIIIVCIMCKT